MPRKGLFLENSMRTPAHRAADRRYAENIQHITIKLNLTKPSDAELFVHLNAQGDKTAYIKKLIQEDIKLS